MGHLYVWGCRLVRWQRVEMFQLKLVTVYVRITAVLIIHRYFHNL